MITDPSASGREAVEQMYSDYLRDESNFTGFAEAVFFPGTEEELRSVLEAAVSNGMDVTISAGRTGITGGAVPQGGWLVSLERMDRFIGLRYDEPSDSFLLRVQAGVRLSSVQEAAAAGDFPGSAGWDSDSQTALDRLQQEGKKYFYAPDPTETDSCLGGNAACNASGARSYKYGPTRRHIESLRVLLTDGSAVDLRRGEGAKYVDGRKVFQIPAHGREVPLPEIRWPVVKNASGYCLGKHFDVMDMFIGSEGTLGVITEMEIRLIPAPVQRGEVLLQLDTEETAIDLIEILEDTNIFIASIEYLCPRALRFLYEHKKLEGLGIQISDGLPPPVLLIELEADGEGFDQQLRALTSKMEQWSIEPVTTLVATGLADLERFRVLRHSLPETINEVIAGVKGDHPGVSKLGMDFAVPRARLHEMVGSYHEVLGPPGLYYVLFGHIGSDHIHVNIIPRNQSEYDSGKEAYRRLAQRAVDLGGTVSAEHGIGKLKRDLLLMMYSREDIAKMRSVKEALDPGWTLGQGTLFFMRGDIEECGR